MGCWSSSKSVQDRLGFCPVFSALVFLCRSMAGSLDTVMTADSVKLVTPTSTLLLQSSFSMVSCELLMSGRTVLVTVVSMFTSRDFVGLFFELLDFFSIGSSSNQDRKTVVVFFS